MRGLRVENLHVRVGPNTVLQGVSLDVKPGEIHALMGPNGSGKSTLAYAIMGREIFDVPGGRIILDGEDITGLPTYERALKGIFLAMQEPPEIPGVRMSSFLIAIKNKSMGETDDLFKLRDPRFLVQLRKLINKVGLPSNVLQREVNRGFSGGEKKRSELLQALIIDPKYLLLDEPDSGLDVDGVRTVASILREKKEEGKGILLITHYTRMFNFIEPDRISILYKGRIVATGGMELAKTIDEVGYKGLIKRLGINGEG
ncbi:MAG: Fe-S cluster assembly ATPase SufC [Desulfurococcales archaeon]|nr:Fe-S cluster assembly ATPase SufC [Desulfurococcales archaeon]